MTTGILLPRSRAAQRHSTDGDYLQSGSRTLLANNTAVVRRDCNSQGTLGWVMVATAGAVATATVATVVSVVSAEMAVKVTEVVTGVVTVVAAEMAVAVAVA